MLDIGTRLDINNLPSGTDPADLDPARMHFLDVMWGDQKQTFELACQKRHFGGHQWYFVCPKTRRLCTILWRPPGATSFASRLAWGSRVAYAAQFRSRQGRLIHRAMQLRCNLGGPGWESLAGGKLPKPKYMRWRTYERMAAKARQAQVRALHKLTFVVEREGLGRR
jgi:hypothetical protein